MVATRAAATVIPHLVEAAVIPGLPPHLQRVPEEQVAWEAWREQVMAYRELVRRRAATNRQLQRVEIEKCTRDEAYFITMYGVIFEPRAIDNGVPAGWLRWIPYPFQVKLIRWIQWVLTQSEKGRGDGVVEKSRDMGASWTFCGFIAARWLCAPSFVAGLISYKEELVDKPGDTDTLFYKIRSNLAMEEGVPPEIRLPSWFVPKGFDRDKHCLHRLIMHPTKTCVIRGETTTALSGVAGRATMRLNDELSRFRDAEASWSNQNATTTHRFGVWTADTKYGPFAYELARQAERGLIDGSDAPSYMRLNWWIHPEHTQGWYDNERSRNVNRLDWFAREYDIDYFAGQGEYVYPIFQKIAPVSAPYDPLLGQLYGFIDPGIRDPTAISWWQEDPRERRFRCVEAFQGKGGEPAEFYASVLCGIPISGYGGYAYRDYPGLIDVMAWTGDLLRPVIYYGDHYGTHRGGGGRTWYDVLYEKSHELTAGRGPITVRTATTEDARSYDVRKEAVLGVASRLDFHNTLRVRQVLLALQRSRYREKPIAGASSAEPLVPLHDEHSHFRSGVEFGFVNLLRIEQWASRPKAKAVRRTMRGTLVTR